MALYTELLLGSIVSMQEVETLRLPLSGLIYQRRSDRQWRCITQAQHAAEVAGRHQPRAVDWVSEELQIEGGGRAQWGPGQHDDEATWWVLYGDHRAGGPVTVTLADGRTPPIVDFGPLWLCEWTSRTQAAVVTVRQHSYTLFDRVPGYISTPSRGTE